MGEKLIKYQANSSFVHVRCSHEHCFTKLTKHWFYKEIFDADHSLGLKDLKGHCMVI